MAEVVTNGYLIDKIDYQTFDEIITFINVHGNKFTAIARGTKRIRSHNARNLQIGNYCEFKFFLARLDNKVSKLVWAHTIKPIPWPNLKQSFATLNLLAKQLIYPNKANFLFYRSMLNYINNSKIDDKKTELIILRNYCHLTGIDIHVNNCVICHNHHIKTISFKHHGLLCGRCFNNLKEVFFPLELSKLSYFLFKNQYDKLNMYSKYYSKLIKLLKEYIKQNNGTFFTNM